MLSNTEFWVETSATATVLLLIPLYMGLIHVSPVGAVAYAGVGGVAMAVGEDLQFGLAAVRPSLVDVLLWACAIAGSGGIFYLLALWLI
ncbi:MAG: hypothetical protein ACXWUN_06795 [Allosphingosinicella sp.]